MNKVNNLGKILVCMMFFAFITLLNQTSINTALTTIRHEFNISTSVVQWMSTIYLLVSGIMVPITAYLSTRFSIRRLFIVSLLLFIVGMFIAGFASSYSVLLLGRIIQALGGGISAPLMQTVIFLLAPINKRGSIMGVVGIVFAVAPGLGPSISGYLVSHYNWHSIFLIYIPILILNLVMAMYFMPELNKGDDSKKLDVMSVMLSTITFGSILYGVSMIGSKGFVSPFVYVPVILGLLFFIIFYKKQMSMSEPLLNFHVFDYKVFRLAIFLITMANIALLGVALLLPIYLQEIHGYSAVHTGLILLPGPLVSSLTSLMTGKIFDKYGAKWVTIIGFIAMALATYNLSQLTITSVTISIMVVYTIRCIAVSMIMMPPQTAGMNTLPKELIGHGAAMLNTIRTIAGSVGTAVLVSIMMYVAQNHKNVNNYTELQSLSHGYTVAMYGATIIAVIGFLLALRLPSVKIHRKGRK